MLLTTARTLFPGAMGPEGFISCFDHLMDDALLRRKLILKGGPGVGKSTFMRRVHAALCANGEPSTLSFCSGDPDSLDGVAVPHAGLLILDGTAPHIVDPEIPGARDSIINLGECLNEPAMRPRLSPIRACMADNAACSRRARACLAAAAALARENAAILQSAADTERLFRMTQALTQAVLVPSAPTESAPSMRPVITEAMTPKGEISLIAENAQPRVIRLLFHWGMDGTPVLRQLSAAARAAGYSTEEHLCPTVPAACSTSAFRRCLPLSPRANSSPPNRPSTLPPVSRGARCCATSARWNRAAPEFSSICIAQAPRSRRPRNCTTSWNPSMCPIWILPNGRRFWIERWKA